MGNGFAARRAALAARVGAGRPAGCARALALAGGSLGAPAPQMPDPGAAAVVVLAVAVAAVDADRPAVGVGGDHRVHAIGLAGAAEVLDRFAGAVAAA